jgi:hypothetical protein
VEGFECWQEAGRIDEQQQQHHHQAVMDASTPPSTSLPRLTPHSDAAAALPHAAPTQAKDEDEMAHPEDAVALKQLELYHRAVQLLAGEPRLVALLLGNYAEMLHRCSRLNDAAEIASRAMKMADEVEDGVAYQTNRARFFRSTTAAAAAAAAAAKVETAATTLQATQTPATTAAALPAPPAPAPTLLASDSAGCSSNTGAVEGDTSLDEGEGDDENDTGNGSGNGNGKGNEKKAGVATALHPGLSRDYFGTSRNCSPLQGIRGSLEGKGAELEAAMLLGVGRDGWSHVGVRTVRCVWCLVVHDFVLEEKAACCVGIHTCCWGWSPTCM